MDFFDMILLNIILLSVPIFIYMLYILTDKNIDQRLKDAYFGLALSTSFFLLNNYGIFIDVKMVVLFTGIILFLACWKSHFVLATGFSIANIIMHIRDEKLIIFFLLSYSLIIASVYIKNKKDIDEGNLLNIFILGYSILFILWGISFRMNILQCLILSLMFGTCLQLIYFFFNRATDTLRTHLQFKELQQDKQIQFSLFKITHEIKNPIAVCKAYLDMFDINNKEHAQKYIPIIRGEVERLLLLLQDFLLVNRENMKYEIMDVNMLLEDVADKVGDLMLENSIDFKMKCIDDELLINGDYNRLSQVLINIIKNSMEADSNKIALKTHLTKHDIELYVSDNGVGINKESLRKIYEPFYTTKSTGTGLGVSLSKEIIEAHGGELEYFSSPHKGTVVKITIPVHQFINE